MTVISCWVTFCLCPNLHCYIVCTCVFLLISSRGSGSREVRQVMWHVVSGRHHVHPVSTVFVWRPVRISPQMLLYDACICIWILLREALLNFITFLNGCHHYSLFVSADCAASLRFTRIQAKLFLLGWRGGSGWASMNFLIQSGRRCHRKVRNSNWNTVKQQNSLQPYRQRAHIVTVRSICLWTRTQFL